MVNKKEAERSLDLKKAALIAFRAWRYKGSLYLRVVEQTNGLEVILSDVCREDHKIKEGEEGWAYKMCVGWEYHYLLPPGLLHYGGESWFSDKEDSLIKLLTVIAREWYESTVVIHCEENSSSREDVLEGEGRVALMRYLAAFRQR
jgi:hypothetical protein